MASTATFTKTGSVYEHTFTSAGKPRTFYVSFDTLKENPKNKPRVRVMARLRNSEDYTDIKSVTNEGGNDIIFAVDVQQYVQIKLQTYSQVTASYVEEE